MLSASHQLWLGQLGMTSASTTAGLFCCLQPVVDLAKYALEVASLETKGGETEWLQ